MKNTNDQINLSIRMIENEQVPEWINQYTVWVETKSNEGTTAEDLKDMIQQ
jgi:hypothetical protein